jgi:hypothetical protein
VKEAAAIPMHADIELKMGIRTSDVNRNPSLPDEGVEVSPDVRSDKNEAGKRRNSYSYAYGVS